MFALARVVVPPSIIRSEFALEPLMTPLTVMPLLPPASLRVVPFLVSEPESVSRPLPVFWIVPVPLVTVMLRVRLPATPV